MKINHNDFDKKMFSSLLLSLKGNRTLTKFAAETNSSIAHLSRMINEKLDSPPSPETIKKLLYNKHSEVTYEDLMVAAGYIQVDYNLAGDIIYTIDSPSDISLSDNSTNTSTEQIKKYKIPYLSTIILNLGLNDYTWQIPNKKNILSSVENEFTLDLVDSYIKSWIFGLISMKPSLKDQSLLQYQLKKLIQNTWGKLALYPINSYSKYSLVTNCDILYNAFVNSAPQNLNLTISIILIDPDEFTILKEEYVSYSHEVNIPKMQEFILCNPQV